jgi:hypothetical protein
MSLECKLILIMALVVISLQIAVLVQQSRIERVEIRRRCEGCTKWP